MEGNVPVELHADSDGSETILARFTVPEQHLRLLQVNLQDQSDKHNELVSVREWLLHPVESLELAGNLFVIENTLTGHGRILLKTQPLPHARSAPPRRDLRATPLKSTGFEFTVFDENNAGSAAFVDLPYEGGLAGRTLALQQFQRGLRPATAAHRVPRFLSNTWGDRSRDSRISHAFIEAEIRAGQRLGVEVVQIDDGWQTGITANSARSAGKGAWKGFWSQPDFWTPHPDRFPGGLTPLIDLAARNGMLIGLWYAPDSHNDFHHWQKDVQCLLGLHRTLGIQHIKIDGIQAPTALAQANLTRLFDTLLRESAGNLVFDLDITAQLRPGFFGLPTVGPLFLENRYTDWHRYWPHQTLRNLWHLAWWVDPGRLRMEFLNNARNTHLYPADPLAPAHYTPDALFATVFFANPLGWFEVSNLPDGYSEAVAPLVTAWKSLRLDIFGGCILPLGSAPDGIDWTGFASVASDGRSAVALIFRESNPAATWSGVIPGFGNGRGIRCEVLHGTGSASWADGRLHCANVAPLGYLLVRLTAG